MHLVFQSKQWIIISTALIFLLSTLFHFLYDFSHHNFFIGLFVPVNESVFEHLKMIPIPMFLCWLMAYRLYRDDIQCENWFFAAVMSMLICMGIIISLYYLYTGMLGIESVLIDILIMAIAILTGQWCSQYVLSWPNVPSVTVTFLLFMILIVIFACLTLFPPQIPFFVDPTLSESVQ